MFSAFSKVRRAILKTVAAAALVLAAACEPINLASVGGGGPKVDTSKPIPVALLVPGGSQNATDGFLAQTLENAARLAMAELEGVNIDLRVYNTAGNGPQAAQMAVAAVNDGAKIILGPVFSEAANAAGVAIANTNVNLLSFSNNTSIAGGNVFVLGPTFQNTANRLVGYATRNGRSDILVVHANNVSGIAGRDAITKAIAASGARSAGVTPYEFSQNGVVQAISGIRSAARSTGADAVLFTSDSAGAMPLFAQLLPEAGLSPNNIKYMGLTRWDIPPQTLTLPGLQGGWFTMPDTAMNARFQSRYSAAYGGNPHPIAGLAFDGIAAIGALVAQGNRDALTKQALTQGSGFQGTNGIFRLLPDGTNERGLAVAEVRNNQVEIIDPAPRNFPGAGL